MFKSVLIPALLLSSLAYPSLSVSDTVVAVSGTTGMKLEIYNGKVESHKGEFGVYGIATSDRFSPRVNDTHIIVKEVEGEYVGDLDFYLTTKELLELRDYLKSGELESTCDLKDNLIIYRVNRGEHQELITIQEESVGSLIKLLESWNEG